MKEGWEVKTLGDVSDFKGGSQPPKSQFISEPCEGYIRMLQIRDFKSDARAVYIPNSKKTNVCGVDDIMIGRYGTSVGQIHRGKAGAYNVALIRTIPNLDMIDRNFFYYFLTSSLFQKPLAEVSVRGAQNGFSKPDIAPFPVPLPPLDEQKRIVALLDEAFAGIAVATAAATKNLKNARELFEITLNTTFTQKGEGWLETTLGEVCERFEYGTSTKSQKTGLIPVLRMGNIQNREIDWEKLVYTDNKADIEKLSLKDGDVLFNRTNSPALVGKSAIYRGESSAIFAGYLIRVHRKELCISAEFLNYFLNSFPARDYGRTVMSGSVNQANINGSKLKQYPICLPADLTVQMQIIEMLNTLSTQTQRLEALYQQKIDALNQLKQSLLQKAFAGELTCVLTAEPHPLEATG